MEEYKKRIKDTIDRFYVDCVEEFKEAGVYQEMQNILRRPGSHPSPLH